MNDFYNANYLNNKKRSNSLQYKKQQYFEVQNQFIKIKEEKKRELIHKKSEKSLKIENLEELK